MKNLLIYTREDKQFSKEAKTLAKIQVDNSLLFFKAEDILIFTNFKFEHNGIKSIIIPDCSYKPDRTNKIPAIVYLIENRLLPNEYIWYHDFDAFQIKNLNPNIGGLSLGLTSYGYKDSWNGGSFFFKPNKDVFKLWNSEIRPENRCDEKALNRLTRDFKLGYEHLGVIYNFNQRLPYFSQFDSIEPSVLHFHPNYKYYRADETNINIFMYGKNRLGKIYMPTQLINIFKSHGVE